MASTGASTGASAPPDGAPAGPRAQAPIRWPHPDRLTVSAVTTWVLGLLIGLAIPAAIVSPNRKFAPAGRVWTAFSFSVLGAVLMIGAAAVHWRRRGQAESLVLGAVPAVTVLVGGIILATAKIYGGR